MSDGLGARGKLSTSRLVAFAAVVLLGLGLFFWLAPRTQVVVVASVLE